MPGLWGRWATAKASGCQAAERAFCTEDLMPARCVPTAGPSPQAGGVLSLPSLCPLVIFGETEGFYDPDAIWVPGGGPLWNPHSDWICNQAALAQKLLPMKEEILTQPLSAPRPQGLWRSWRGREEPWGPVILGRQRPQNTPQGHAGDTHLQQPEPHRPATCLPPTLPNHFFD